MVGGLVVWGGLVACWAPVVNRQRELKLDQDRVHAEARRSVGTLEFQSVPPGPDEAGVPLVAANLASIAGVLPVSSSALQGVLMLPLLVVGVAFLRLLRRGEFTAVASVCAGAAVVLGTCVLMGAAGVERRYLLVLAPLGCVLTGKALHSVAVSRHRGWTYVAVFCALVLVSQQVAGIARIWRRHYETPTQDLLRFLQESDAHPSVVFSSPHGQIPLEYYAARTGIEFQATGFPVAIEDWWEGQAFKGWGSPPALEEEVSELIRRLAEAPAGSRTWIVLFESEHYDPQGRLVEELLKARALVVEEKQLGLPGLVGPYRLLEVSTVGEVDLRSRSH
jgi:hypothetical protein